MKYDYNSKKGYFDNALDFIINTVNIGLWDFRVPNRKLDSGTALDKFLEYEAVYSKEFEQILGYEEGELQPFVSSWIKIIYPEDREDVFQKNEAHLLGKTELYEAQYRIIRKDGAIIWIKDVGRVIEWDNQGNPLRFTGIMQDISSIKKDKEALTIKNEQLDLVTKMSGLILWDYDASRGNIWYDDEFFKVTGYTRTEILGIRAGWNKLVHPNDIGRILKIAEQLLQGKIDTFSEEIRIWCKNGQYIWIMSTGRTVAWREDGTAAKIVGGFLNIDKLKRAEEKLQETLQKNEQYNKQLTVEVQDAVKNLEASSQFNQIMFESNPHVNLILNDEFDLLDCNPVAVKYFGFSSKEEAVQGMMLLLNKSVPPVQPDGRRSYSVKDRLEFAARHGYCDFETYLNINGKNTPLRVILKRIPYKDSFAITAYLVDLRSLWEAKNELIHQDRILRIMNESATRLLASDQEGFDQVVWESMQSIGKSVNANRMYIWENFTGNGKCCCRQIYEWSEGVEPQQGNEFTIRLDYDAIPYRRDMLNKHKTINMLVKDYPGLHEQELFEMQGIRSILIIPIFFKDNFWGFVGFDDCKHDRLFSSAEEHLLYSGCFLLVSAILKNNVAKQLIKAREEALANTRAKSEFLSRMTHEIRTPMNAIIGMTTIARKHDDVVKMQYCLSKIDSASRQLLELINDILDMSKIEANKFEISSGEFNFETLIQDVVNVIQIRVEEKKQQFIVDFDDIFTRNVISDELRLFQIMLNLLSNAVKFTSDAGTIILKVRRNDIDADRAQLRVEIKDTGIGISREQQSRLFTSFEQADGSITRKFGGTGLGLALCKKILDLMDGTIWIESELGKGATFIFTINITWGGECWKTPEAEKIIYKDFPILVIDDSEDVLEYFKNILSSFSMHCETANSGSAGLALLEAQISDNTPYRIVFVDWKMPGENGLEIAKKIREIAGSDIGIVLMSVADWSEIKSETTAGSLSINQFLIKPIMPSALYNMIVSVSQQTFVTENRNLEIPNLSLTEKRILIVEDIEINREIIGSILEETGVSIDYAENGRFAVETFRKQGDRYDLILMDIQMPELDGLDATRQIRALNTECAQSIPIIAMTANAFNEDIEKCLAAGMNNHVAKPIDVESLLKTLTKYLQEPLD